MSDASDALEKLVQEYIFKGAAFTPPTTYWVGLYTAAPNDAGGGTEVATAGGTNYVRIPVTTAGWSTSGSTIKNTSSIDWPVAGANWGKIIAVALHDSSVTSVASTIHFWTTVSSRTVNSGESIRFPTTALHITLD